MRIFLAPMEGVVDHIVRDLLTEIGGIDRCVTEFVRVGDQLLPPRVFYRFCPELHHQGKTPNGVPVILQLLGGKPIPMAENAARAAELGAPGIDINFGCPAKTVNRHDGGASLLKEPERIYQIVKAVRNAVPPAIPDSAKIRLGFSDTSLLFANAAAVADAGANELTIHARTKQDGYKPPAYWDRIGEVRQRLAINVVANGEVWSTNDYQRCRRESGCDDVMIGRGLIRYPDLAKTIKRHNEQQSGLKPIDVLDVLIRFYNKAQEDQKSPRYLADRTKQWASLLGIGHPQIMVLFHQIKRETAPDKIFSILQRAHHGDCDGIRALA